LPDEYAIVSALNVEVPGPDPFYAQQPSCQVSGLWFLYERFLGKRTEGCFVEVGAYDGVFASNTWGLALRGWRGLMIEPIPALAELCRANHAEHPGVAVREVAIGAPGMSHVTLQLAGTLTTANPNLAAEYADVDWASPYLSDQRLDAPCVTLGDLLSEEAIARGFDVLVVDVEGFEKQVFAGFDLKLWGPKMLLVELADTHPDLLATCCSDAKLGLFIQDAGYQVVFKDSINTVFVRHDVWSDAFVLARNT
jgi:FkbM family methyltransferase